ncbi:hypothetical protein LTR08_002564 [Meristemomyces frigidus]|nr:hypothetical protein LTR08_002564 [Meristemomyces frigidus]
MAAQIALADVMFDFTTATEAASQGLPASASLVPPKDGITLLDAKNDIFLAYLQALALRNLNVIRSIKNGGDPAEAQKLSNDITRKLVEHRVYLERGVKPLELKIKYQVDKVVKAADDEDRAVALKAKTAAVMNGKAAKTGSDNDSEDQTSDSDDEAETGAEIAAQSFRPNAATFAQTTGEDAYAARRAQSKDDGVYRPPRISATAMPTTESRERKEQRSRPERSRTVDEYISTELSTAPVAQPSIGSTITAGGRKNKDAYQLRKEAERQEYEETNLVRLPKEAQKKNGGRSEKGGFGGEEWRDLGASVDRIGDLTRRKGGKDGALEKSRKRRTVEDGPRDSGTGGIGEAFDVKRRRLEKKTRR